MRKFFKLLTLVAATAASTASVHAGVVNFDQDVDFTYTPFAPLVTHISELQQNGYWIDSYSTKAGAAEFDLVGALVDGTDVAATCSGVVCPGNNNTNFLAMLNSGLPFIGRLDGTAQRLLSLDASFIAAEGALVPGIPMILSVQGYDELGNPAEYEDILIDGAAPNGSLSFASYQLSADFSSKAYSFFGFWAYACNSAGSCSRNNNTAQFALDNITFADVQNVPEPTSLALAGLALAGLATARRRSATKA